ncbi:hypothetical protein FB451DRAFT_1189972 [Mycena latifolia]|nr:hypothetical protein FB451DRAFT_1189972 [Mycena latifolia]
MSSIITGRMGKFQEGNTKWPKNTELLIQPDSCSKIVQPQGISHDITDDEGIPGLHTYPFSDVGPNLRWGKHQEATQGGAPLRVNRTATAASQRVTAASQRVTAASVARQCASVRAAAASFLPDPQIWNDPRAVPVSDISSIHTRTRTQRISLLGALEVPVFVKMLTISEGAGLAHADVMRCVRQYPGLTALVLDARGRRRMNTCARTQTPHLDLGSMYTSIVAKGAFTRHVRRFQFQDERRSAVLILLDATHPPRRASPRYQRTLRLRTPVFGRL